MVMLTEDPYECGRCGKSTSEWSGMQCTKINQIAWFGKGKDDGICMSCAVTAAKKLEKIVEWFFGQSDEFRKKYESKLFKEAKEFFDGAKNKKRLGLPKMINLGELHE